MTSFQLTSAEPYLQVLVDGVSDLERLRSDDTSDDAGVVER
jgi:hypothetical protein